MGWLGVLCFLIASISFASNEQIDCKARVASTIAYYDSEGAAEYSKRTSADLSRQYEEFLSLLPKRVNARILDAGCGAGKDSEYFISREMNVVPYDGSRSMVDFTAGRLGIPVLHKQFHEIDFVNEFDGVWAMSSFLHAPLEQLPDIIKRHVRALRSGGIFFMSFLATSDGTGESFSVEGPEYSRGRLWLKLGRAELEPMLTKVPDAEMIRITDPVPDGVAGRHPVLWTEVLLRKR